MAASLPSDRPAYLPRTPLIGRERELVAVRDLLVLEEVPLLTVTGPAGVGKTRLALSVAAAAADAFPDGCAVVRLAPIGDPSLVASAIAQALGVREVGDAPLVDRLAAVMRDWRSLLVLDNFEHVVTAAPLVADLLGACPGVTALVTSRARLRLSGEREFPLAPLALPAVDEPPSLDAAARSEAVRLFTVRAEAVKPDFALTDENAQAVTAICRRLDGLPLAIELAAARVKMLPPETLLTRLERRLPLLTGGPRDVPTRLQTMRGAIAWSYDLLAPEEQVTFRRLAVFVSGFTIEAAEAVTAAVGDTGIDVLDGVGALLDTSLLARSDGAGGEPRYGMLETIREFAVERLETSDDATATYQAHAAWCVAFAEAANPTRNPMAEVAGLDGLAAEYDNLRAALGWLDRVGDAAGLLRLAVAMAGFWFYRSHRREGRHWLERGLERGPGVSWSVRAPALVVAGVITHYHGDAEQGAALIEESLSLRRAGGDAWGTAHSLFFLGLLAVDRGDYNAAADHVEHAVAALTALDDRSLLAFSHNQLGAIAFARGDVTGAEAHLHEALARHREQENAYGMVLALDYLGLVATSHGDLATAARCHQESLAILREVGPAERLAEWLARVATLAVTAGQAMQATRLAAAAEAARLTVGSVWVLPERLSYERTAQSLRADLGDEAFRASWAAGQALTPEQAATEGEGVLATIVPTTHVAPPERASPFGLTPREGDVLRLLAEGHTDREIAEMLFIGPRTVQTHVANLFGKLGVNARAEAAAVAVRRGLV